MSEFLDSGYAVEDEDYSILRDDVPTRDTMNDPPSPEAPRDEPGPAPDTSFVDGPKQTVRSKQYERKARKSLNKLMRLLLSRAQTQADGAALILAGPDISRAFGDTADKSKFLRDILEMGEAGTDSPLLGLVTSLTPFLAQVVRNHEKTFEPAPRVLAIPRTGIRIRLPKLGIRLGKFRNVLTHDPEELTRSVLTDPGVMASLRKMGMMGDE